jgi:hypothetical protein
MDVLLTNQRMERMAQGRMDAPFCGLKGISLFMIGIFALEKSNNFVENLTNSTLFVAIFALFLNLSSTNLLKQNKEVP